MELAIRSATDRRSRLICGLQPTLTAKRAELDAKTVKGIAQECWAVSDNAQTFAHALEERGLYLAKGDRRSHVAVTYEGEVFALSRLIGMKTKDVRAKLGLR